MKVRVRVLHAQLDPNGAQQLADSIGSFGTQRVSGELRLATVELEAPLKVTSFDEEVDVEELERQVLAGRVRPTDLVNDGSRWMTVDEFPPLGDACARAPRSLLPEPEVREELVWPAVRLTIIAAAVVTFLYLALKSHL